MAKLVAIGDSLTQGFQSAAIAHVDLSFPALIAGCMRLGLGDFTYPDFTGSGGLPVNLEWIARKLAQRFNNHIGTFAWPAAFFDIAELIDQVEDYWERGPGSKPVADTLFHNLAVWGFEAADAFQITAGEAFRRATADRTDNWFQPPSEPEMRTAWRVLNPGLNAGRALDTQIEVAKRIKARDGEIENLIVWLGANNALGSVVRLDVTKETGPKPPGPFSDRTLWSPAAFEADYDALAAEVAEIGAKNVFVATVPHVTIAPITKGIMENRGRLPLTEMYFDYYTWFFVEDDAFDPKRDPRLTKADAELIDGYINQYNEIIRERAERYGWEVVDICGMLDALAYKRNYGRPTYPLPPELSDLDVRYLKVSPTGALQEGGFFSLDGVHPTTCGYALIAAEFIKVMNTRRAAGDQIALPAYAKIREMDTLVSHAPGTLHDMEGLLGFLEKRFHFTQWLKRGL